MPLTEPQAIFLGVAAFLILAGLVASWVLSSTEPRCCRICERLEIVEPGASSPGWAEPTLCMECATFKAAIKEECYCGGLSRDPEARDGHR